jgi:hypothetical protein
MATVLAPAIPLTEPHWQRQAAETDQEWFAFAAYLETRSMAQASARTGYRYEAIEHTAVRWSWHTRTQAWDRSVASAGWEAAKDAFRAAVVRTTELRAAFATHMLELAAREAAKHNAASKDTPAVYLDKILDVQRADASARATIADGIPETDTGAPNTRPTTVDYGKLTAEEMIQLDRLRAKARAG